MLQDIRYAWRLIWRTRAASLGAIVALGLGIGVVTALYSVVYGVAMKPLPYARPDRLIIVGVQDQEHPGPGAAGLSYVFTGAQVAVVAMLHDVFSGVTALELWTTNKAPRQTLTGPQGAERLRGGLVTADFFGLLGVNAAVGRTSLGPDDVVISNSLWKRAFGADPQVIGRIVRLDGTPFTVIGVLPAEFRFTYPDETEFWCRLSRVDTASAGLAYHIVGRLRDGVSADQATAALRTAAASRDGRAVRETGQIIAQPLDEWISRAVRPLLFLVWGAAALLCVAACLNASLLLVSRASRRTRDAAIRTAMGAPPGRLARQGAAENLVIGLSGSILGVILAAGMIPLIKWVMPPVVPRMDEIAIDRPVLLFAVAAGLACTALAGVPAHRVLRLPNLSSVIGQLSETTTAGRRAAGRRRLLLALESASIVVLLTAGCLLLESFWKLSRIDLGFDPAGLAVVQTRLMRVPDPDTWRVYASRFATDLHNSIKAIPGVLDAATTTTVPFRGFDEKTWVPQGGPAVAMTTRIPTSVRSVTPEFFRLFGIHMIAGRPFSERDASGSTRVAVISASLARALFGSDPAVGRVLFWGDPYQIVGVVADVRWRNPEEAPRPSFYVPFRQAPSTVIAVVARTTLDLATFAASVRTAVRTVDATQPVDEVATVEHLLATASAQRRFYALATVYFGCIALTLAALGILGAVGANVAEQRREIAIRVVFGADPWAIRAFTMRQILVPVAIGVSVGAVVALWIAQGMRSWLFEVNPTDPIAFVLVPTTVIAVAVAATWPSARRAVALRPVEALRHE